MLLPVENATERLGISQCLHYEMCAVVLSLHIRTTRLGSRRIVKNGAADLDDFSANDGGIVR